MGWRPLGSGDRFAGAAHTYTAGLFSEALTSLQECDQIKWNSRLLNKDLCEHQLWIWDQSFKGYFLMSSSNRCVSWLWSSNGWVGSCPGPLVLGSLVGRLSFKTWILRVKLQLQLCVQNYMWMKVTELRYLATWIVRASNIEIPLIAPRNEFTNKIGDVKCCRCTTASAVLEAWLSPLQDLILPISLTSSL